MTRIRSWEADLSRRLNIGGLIEFDRTSVAKTLHVPCAPGKHLVDFAVQANLDPNGTVKRMIHAGWIVGRRRLVCPDCNRAATQAKEDRRHAEPTPSAPPRRGCVDNISKFNATLTPDQRADRARKGAAARWAKFRKDKEEMPEQPKPEAIPTPAAGKARRMAYLALEDYYDEAHKRYKEGWTDKKIGAEVGLAEAEVARIRDQDFGTLGEPEELATLRLELNHAKRTGAEAMAKYQREIERIERKFETLCQKNGWAVA